MKTLLVLLAVVLSIVTNVQAQETNVLGAFIAPSKGSVNKVYTSLEVKQLLESDKVACVSFDRKAYLSKGYIAKFGETKDFCNAKDAKSYNFIRLNKNNLPLEIRKLAKK